MPLFECHSRGVLDKEKPVFATMKLVESSRFLYKRTRVVQSLIMTVHQDKEQACFPFGFVPIKSAWASQSHMALPECLFQQQCRTWTLLFNFTISAPTQQHSP